MKPDVAFYWCASCGGCDEAVLDLGSEILSLTDSVNIVFWPVAMDFKEKDVEARPDGSIYASFINGAVRTTEQARMARLLRKKSKLIVAFGACAQLGGIPGLANLTDAAGILQEAYPDGSGPLTAYDDNGHELTLPQLFDTVLPLDRTISVDYYVPGCPPTPKIIADALHALLAAEPPPKGAMLAPDQALCEQCPRKDTRPHELLLKQFRRISEHLLDPQVCILAQGVLCLGPVTRSGCEASCIAGNMPCTGCFGPTSRVRDFGAKALAAAASIVDSREESEAERIFDTFTDPVGTFYRYSLPSSLLVRKRLR
jgi:F420-non-reducing hydrogenase small subunit